MNPSLDFISDESIRTSVAASLLQHPQAAPMLEPTGKPNSSEAQLALEEIAVMRALHDVLQRFRDEGDDSRKEALVRDMIRSVAAAAVAQPAAIAAQADPSQQTLLLTNVLPFALYQLQNSTSQGYYEVRNSLSSQLANELLESVDVHIANGTLADSMLVLVPLLEMVFSDEALEEEQKQLCIGIGEISLNSKGLQQLPEDPQRQSQDGDDHLAGSVADNPSTTTGERRQISVADSKLMSACNHAARSLAKSVSVVYRLAPSCSSTPNAFVEHGRVLM